MPSVFQYLSRPSLKGGCAWAYPYMFSLEIKGYSKCSSRDVGQMLEIRLAVHADSGFPFGTLDKTKLVIQILATLSVVNVPELADEDKAWSEENTRSFERNGYGGRRSTIGSRKMPTLFLS